MVQGVLLMRLLRDDLSPRDRLRWDEALSLLERFVAERSDRLEGVRQSARQVAEGISNVDAFLQENTAAVCPSCRRVCCANRHAFYDHEDLIYSYALERKPPRYAEERGDAEPCQFIGPAGCTIARALRPFRCTWYFCDTLLKHLESGPARAYRLFVDRFRQTVEARGAMSDEFFQILRQSTEPHDCIAAGDLLG